MKEYRNILFISILATTTLFTSCKKGNNKADGYGNFEAKEITISAENNGKLLQFTIGEGQQLNANQYIGYIDTIPLSLKKKQLELSKQVIASKSTGVLSQIHVLNAQIKTAFINKKRVENLIIDHAGTQKQLDDVQGQINVIQQQIRSVKSQNAPIINELQTLDNQIDQINDQISKCVLKNPIKGTVLTQYAEENEITTFGKPLYKIADLSTLQLRVYVSETQLAKLKIGNEVTVKIDDNEGMKDYKGKITWIASEAEFTPKIIQTKEERTALVYGVKVDVKNDGSLKIGMPAEMWLKSE